MPAERRDAPAVRVDSRDAIAQSACPLSDSDLRTTITEVRFTGFDGTPLPAELAPLLRDVGGVGADQSIKVVCDIRDRANAALRAARYVATVQIPAQRIEDGILKLEVVSARIVEMRVRGDAGPYESVLQSRIELLKQVNPLNEEEAERILLLAGDVPGLDVQLSLRPTGKVPGDVIGEMAVSYRPFSIIANVQNYNSRQIGRETAYVRGEIYGLTGMADLTYVGVSSTLDFKEQLIGQAGHVFGVGTAGTTIALRGTYALSKPDLLNLNIKTRTVIASLEVAQPILRSVRFNAGVVGGFEYSRQKTTVQSGAGATPLNLDEISALFIRFAGDGRFSKPDGSELGRASASLELRKGIDVFSPSQTGQSVNGFVPSRFEGDAQATVIRGAVETRIGIGPIFSLTARARGQWANKPLLNFDEFSLGNLTIGRGYDPGANSGDRAIGGSIEAAAMLVKKPTYGIEAFGFYDAVRLWNLDRGSTENNREFRSFGGGARLILPGSLILEVTYAHPRDRALSFDKAPPPDRVLISLTTQLVPWGGRR